MVSNPVPDGHHSHAGSAYSAQSAHGDLTWRSHAPDELAELSLPASSQARGVRPVPPVRPPCASPPVGAEAHGASVRLMSQRILFEAGGAGRAPRPA
jgi:hypothetical protein